VDYAPGTGNPHSKIMLIGDWAGQSEINQKESLVGSTGDVLDRAFSEIGYPDYRSQLYFSNVYKYHPGNVYGALDKELLADSTRKLWAEIQDINPNVIVTLGELPLNVVCGVKKVMTYRGTVLPNEKFGYLPKVIPTIHPLHLTMPTKLSGDYFETKKLYNGIWKNILQLDLLKALEESSSREFHPPDRLLKVATNSLDVIRFFNQNKGRVPYADVETFRSTLCSCLGIAFDKYEAMSIPLFQKVGDIKLCTIPHSDLARIWQEIQALFSRIKIAGQNLKFDQSKLELLGFRMAVFSDVMLKAHTVNSELPSVSLSFLSSIYTKEPYYKDEGKEFNPAKHDIRRLFLYNAKDCVITAEIDEALELELKELSEQFKTDLVKFYYEYVVPQHQFYFDLEKVGFDVDEGTLKFLQMKYETWRDILQVKLDSAAGYNININSPKQVNEFLYGVMRLPVMTDRNGKVKGDEDAIAKLLKDRVKNEAKREILNSILEFRRVSKTLSTYLLCERDYDSRIRSQYRIIGTETGRSSTSILSEPVRPEDIGFAFQTLTKHGDIGNDIRSYLIPRPGYDLVNVDLSQAEARVVCVLCKDWDLLTAFDSIDIHRRTAWLALVSGVLDLEVGPHHSDSLGKDSPERFIGKKTRHAGNYNMKWREFMSNVISDCRRFNIDFTISKFKAEQILDRFHAASPKIRGVFHAEIKDAIDTTRALVTPYGRLRRFFDRASDRLYGEGFAYIPQETVKGRLTRAGFKIKREAPSVLFCGEAHDSFTMQIPRGETIAICREVIRPAFAEPIDFSNCTLKRDFKLVLPCDFEHGDNYKEMVKLNVMA
jgi:uracil-DNA glycosylase family 4